MQPISEWLSSLDLAQYTAVFQDNGIDVEVLALVSDGDLQELGVLLGHRRKILNAISGQSKGPAVPAPALTPDQYTPKHLTDKILTSKAALEGERKQVTILFADLKGSMELLADRDPEEARAILDPVLEHMMEAVHHYEGTVNQVMGDGIMALFGAPLTHEDHAVRACYAALRMQDSLKRYAEETRHAHGVEIQIRVGLNSGEVVVRSIGSDLRMDYTAVGQNTHLAARMEQLAPPGSVRLTTETVRLVEGYLQVRTLGFVPVKGMPAPIEIFELAGEGPVRTRLQASALRGLTRFVGREAEIEHLRRVLTRVKAGNGQVVALVGEAGVGKSRLVYEFTHSHRVQSWLILEASSVSYGKATSYLPVIDLLKSYFRIGDRDSHREIREKVTGKLFTLDGSLKPILPALLSLFRVPVEDTAWNSLDPAQRRRHTLDAVKRLLLREAQVQPLLVVFEDLHWIDSETQALLDDLVGAIGSAPLLLLLNYRPEYQHHWASKSVYSQLRLDSLLAESAAEFVAGLLGPDAGLVPLAQMLVERGNPFFLEETVRSLVESGVLAGESGAYRLTRPVDSLQVPATVQTILLARIDRLPPAEKQLLQAASVIGKNVPHALLTAIAKQPDGIVQRGLSHLQEAEFLYETQLFPDREFTFKHAITQEVTYGSLLSDPRRQIHARVVTAIEQHYADSLSEHVEHLAHHAWHAQLWELAVQYSRQGGVRALGRSSARDALVHFEQARLALGKLPESRERTEQLIDLRFDQRSALWPLGEFAQMEEAVNDACALAENLGDQQRLGRALGLLASLQSPLGAHARAIEAAERACDIGDAIGDRKLQVSAANYLGYAFWAAGDPPRAVQPLRKAIALVDDASKQERVGLSVLQTLTARQLLARVLAELGEFTEALATGERGLSIARETGRPYREIWPRFSLGHIHLLQGDFAASIQVQEPGLALCRATENGFALLFGATQLGSAYLWTGRAADALALLDEAIETSEAMHIVGHLSVAISFRAEAYFILGRVGEAREEAERAVALVRAEQQHGGVEAWALKLLGDIYAHSPADMEQAGDAYQQALTLAMKLRQRPLMAHCHFGLAMLCRQTNRQEQAREHLASAITLYREMDMRFWLDKAEPLSN
jgi:class 3 adenylate cyclase/tetratricopeptide (TPR) repeat protein